MKPENLKAAKKSFAAQASGFENPGMSLSKKDCLDYALGSMSLTGRDDALEAVAGNCACGRSISSLARTVAGLGATPAMLEAGKAQIVNVLRFSVFFCGLKPPALPALSRHRDKAGSFSISSLPKPANER